MGAEAMPADGGHVRVIQVGYGARGRMWAQVLADNPDTQVVAMVDNSESALRAARSRYGAAGVRFFASLEEALERVEADAAVLVTPPMVHPQQVELAARAGLHLVVEKPLAVDLGQAREMVQMLEERGLLMAVGMNFRYLPVHRAVRDLVAGGELGEPSYGLFVYVRNRDGRRPNLNKYPLTMDDPMLLEQSIHHFDLIRYCYGREVEWVASDDWNPSWSMYRGSSAVAALLGLEGGVRVAYLGTWNSGWEELEFRWRTDCVGGVVIQQELFGGLVVGDRRTGRLEPVPLEEAVPFLDDTRRLWANFLAALRGEEEVECSGRDHLRTLAVTLACLESRRRGTRVFVDRL